MPRRTPRPAAPSKSPPTVARGEGTGRSIQEHMPQAGEIVELARLRPGAPIERLFRHDRWIYARVLHSEACSIRVDICGIRHSLHVEEVLPAEAGYSTMRTVTVCDAEWSKVFGSATC